MHHKTLLIVAGALVVGAYLLSRFGRAAVAGELAGKFGDQGGKDVAASLNVAEAAIAGARKLAGQNAFTPTQLTDVYVAN